MRNLYSRFVLWLIRPALEINQEFHKAEARTMRAKESAKGAVVNISVAQLRSQEPKGHWDPLTNEFIPD